GSYRAARSCPPEGKCDHSRARCGRIDRRNGEPPCARRCRRTDARKICPAIAQRYPLARYLQPSLRRPRPQAARRLRRPLDGRREGRDRGEPLSRAVLDVDQGKFAPKAGRQPYKAASNLSGEWIVVDPLI